MKTKRILVMGLALVAFISVNAQSFGWIETNPTATTAVSRYGTFSIKPTTTGYSSTLSNSGLSVSTNASGGGSYATFNVSGFSLGVSAINTTSSTKISQYGELSLFCLDNTKTAISVGCAGNVPNLFTVSALGAVSATSLNSTGIVKIGSSSLLTPAGYNLYVENGILTEKLKIAIKTTTDWSDFVFANDYKLRSLKSVESFIQKNKHLPDVPSATTVVETGIDVAKMDAVLLQKVEELTLYLIEQNKRIELLEKQNAELLKRTINNN